MQVQSQQVLNLEISACVLFYLPVNGNFLCCPNKTENNISLERKGTERISVISQNLSAVRFLFLATTKSKNMIFARRGD